MSDTQSGVKRKGTGAEETAMETTGEQTIPLDSEERIQLPVVEVLTGRAFLTGKSGAGKSNSASVVAEELLDRGFPLLIVDTDGEYWGLKEEYEILHVGADEECDLQVGSEHAPKLAELALEENVPIILDVSGYLDSDDADALVRETARELFQKEKKRKKPFLMLVEEIHEYIPEGGGLDETGEMLIRVAKRGRKRGLGLAGMSQRPADVKKDFITQCDWLLWHRLTWDNDTDVVRRVVGSDYADAVQDLSDGEAFLMADFLEADVQRVQVRRKRTFDAGATPDLEDFERPDLKSVSGDLVDELEEISEREERRQDRIAQLEAELEARDERIAELEDELEAERQNNETVEKLADKLTTVATGGQGGSEALEEIREEKNAEIRDLTNRLEEREERIAELEEELAAAREELQQRPEIGERAVEAVDVLADEFGVGERDDSKWKRKYQQAKERIEELEEQQQSAHPEPEPLEHPDAERFLEHLENEVDDLGEKAVTMLYYYMMDGPMKAKDAYQKAGGSQKGRYNERRKALLDKGFIDDADGRGVYRYSLDEKIQNRFADHAVVGEDAVEQITREIEDRIRKRALEGSE